MGLMVDHQVSFSFRTLGERETRLCNEEKKILYPVNFVPTFFLFLILLQFFTFINKMV